MKYCSHFTDGKTRLRQVKELLKTADAGFEAGLFGYGTQALSPVAMQWAGTGGVPVGKGGDGVSAEGKAGAIWQQGCWDVVWGRPLQEAWWIEVPRSGGTEAPCAPYQAGGQVPQGSKPK